MNNEQCATNPMAKLLADSFSRETKEGKMNFGNEWMQKMVRKVIAEEMDKMPAKAKAAMQRTQVDIVRHPDQIVIAIDAKGDADVEKVKTVMLDCLLTPISQTIELLGVKANVQSQTG